LIGQTWNRELNPEWIRAGALYFPVVFATAAGLFRGRQPRQFAACLLSFLWTVPALLAVQQLNVWAGWWTYSSDGALFRRMPLELYFGWIVLWGILPQLLFRRLPIAWCAAIMIVVDLFAMPLCQPVVLLSRNWLFGEAVAVLIVLLPALFVARCTFEDSRLRARAAMQVTIAGMLFLYLVPEVAFALRPGRGWTPLLQMSSLERQIGLLLLFVLAVPGLGAVMEFAERGSGTPIPYDPPKRLVTSGIYRYCANPMQLSCALVMVLWACLLQNGWLLIAAAISIVYSAGIAEWDEGEDLTRRFEAEWRQYRAQVRSWLPRWKPYHTVPGAQLYMAASCGPCCELRSWLQSRSPLGLEIVDAETLPSGSIQRMRYDPRGGGATIDGVRALGRAMEHLNLGWTIAGAAVRLPIVWQGVQLLMDASGLGPRVLRNKPSCDALKSPALPLLPTTRPTESYSRPGARSRRRLPR
jgi:protein-S-isoprenylcysteine O-methyltransferase Ste14